jgi:GLPGLI family protein
MVALLKMYFMKKLFILTSLFFVFSNSINAQEKNDLAAHVIYKFVSNEKIVAKDGNKKNDLEKLMGRFYKESKTITFNLKFKKNTSFFYVENVLANDDTPLGVYFARNLVSGGNYLTNLKKKTIIKEYKGLGDRFLITSNTKSFSDWTLTKESKMIGKYKCYKATTNKTYKSALGKIVTVEIIAWYAPQIPVKFGIKEYNNLPGLILELKDQRYTFYAHKISFVKESEIEIKPLKGKTITEEEFLKQVEESSGFIMPAKKGN